MLLQDIFIKDNILIVYGMYKFFHYDPEQEMYFYILPLDQPMPARKMHYGNPENNV